MNHNPVIPKKNYRGTGKSASVAALCLLAVVVFIAYEILPPPVAPAQYLAVGSSFASGPGISPRAAGSPLLCGRSASNYAHRLARMRNLSLTDTSCAGATTVNLLSGGQYFQPPQLAPLTTDTQLVTLTIGGNDVHFLADMMRLSCAGRNLMTRLILGGCTPMPAPLIDAAFKALPARFDQIAQQIHRRAPHARIIFVNYLTLIPARGTCPALGLSQESADHMRIITARLAQITAHAAATNHAGLADMAAVSADHNVCSADPWVEGAYPKNLFAAPLHPTSAGMAAIAVELDRILNTTPLNE